ncbi:MAG: mRNA-degrading endonuclease [Alphaproteobacteria bacterium]|jgi:mRNA interferase MazF|nr:mRNA-degrading endonuclease [Alphaproteobacteria bacterium]
MIPDRGDLVWINFNPQIGHEQAGRRPALVITPAEYNALSHCILVCPITSNTAHWPWKVLLPQNGSIQGAVLVDQIKSIDAEARRIEFVGQAVDDMVMAEVVARLETLTT